MGILEGGAGSQGRDLETTHGIWRLLGGSPSARLLSSVTASRSALDLPSCLNSVADNKLTDVAPLGQCTVGDQLPLR